MRKIVSAILFFLTFCAQAQSDSIYQRLQEVEIRPFSQEAQMRMLSSEGFILKRDLKMQMPFSLVSVMNVVPGVRMEERSPGSYRLSIRGSLLRSPFGVRNVKIYLGEFAFTDAGGNTYLNALDLYALNSIRVLKGPEGSLFGANTGGVLLIDPVYKTDDTLLVRASVTGGSFNTLHQHFGIQKKFKKLTLNLAQGFQQSDGYRENSGMRRYYAQAAAAWTYDQKALVNFLFLVSDLGYQTPGGLTLTQFDADPVKARQATTTVPGAVEQKASVYSRVLFGGISHRYHFTERFSHVVSVFGSTVDFKNPFITNFETRYEQTAGARTWLEWKLGLREDVDLRWHLGAEGQQTNSSIVNYGNSGGSKTMVTADDDIHAKQGFLFTRMVADISNRFLVEVALSYNLFAYNYRNYFPDTGSVTRTRKFDPQLIPRVATSWKINSNLAVRASASGGYSSPTISEVRSSNNVVNTGLQAELARNYEAGVLIRGNKNRIWVDVAVFHYRLRNAIVRRIDDDGNDYFVNAGGTKQPGLEAIVSVPVIRENARYLIRSMKFSTSLTYYSFSFENYRLSSEDYSGKALTGVPKYTSMETLSITFPFGFSFYTQYYYCAALPLNDANTVFASDYHLVQMKAAWEKKFKWCSLTVFTGADNVLDQKYSLGNDLNAVGGRYYNAAPGRNYYAGLSIEF